MSTRLSGRYFTTIVYPLSFQEYIEFTEKQKSISILQKKHKVNSYVQFGGFPRIVLENDEIIKQDILKNYFQTIYLKDIIFPHNVRSNKGIQLARRIYYNRRRERNLRSRREENLRTSSLRMDRKSKLLDTDLSVPLKSAKPTNIYICRSVYWNYKNKL